MMTTKDCSSYSKVNAISFTQNRFFDGFRPGLIAIICLVLGLNTQAQAPKPVKTDLASKNKAATEFFYQQIYSKHNIALIDSLVSENYIEHQTTKGFAHNKKGLKTALTEFYKAFPDFDVKVNFMIAKNDMVVAQVTMTGTNTGSFKGMKPSNKKIHVDGVDIVRYKDGKAIEHWGYLEEGKLLTELGVVK